MTRRNIAPIVREDAPEGSIISVERLNKILNANKRSVKLYLVEELGKITEVVFEPGIYTLRPDSDTLWFLIDKKTSWRGFSELNLEQEVKSSNYHIFQHREQAEKYSLELMDSAPYLKWMRDYFTLLKK